MFFLFRSSFLASHWLLFHLLSVFFNATVMFWSYISPIGSAVWIFFHISLFVEFFGFQSGELSCYRSVILNFSLGSGTFDFAYLFLMRYLCLWQCPHWTDWFGFGTCFWLIKLENLAGCWFISLSENSFRNFYLFCCVDQGKLPFLYPWSDYKNVLSQLWSGISNLFLIRDRKV